MSETQDWKERALTAEAALRKIDAIRNSIIGCQKVNWSEHIYPLVAALGEAGFEGQDYETARENVGTLIEQVKAAEGETLRLREALKPFARWWDIEGTGDDVEIYGVSSIVHGEFSITGADLRKAKAALSTPLVVGGYQENQGVSSSSADLGGDHE